MADIDRFSVTAAGTDSGATATQTASAGNTFVVTNISGHGDADSAITIESPASTIIWEGKKDVSVEGLPIEHGGMNVTGAKGAAILGKIAASTSDCQITISGVIK